MSFIWSILAARPAPPPDTHASLFLGHAVLYLLGYKHRNPIIDDPWGLSATAFLLGGGVISNGWIFVGLAHWLSQAITRWQKGKISRPQISRSSIFKVRSRQGFDDWSWVPTEHTRGMPRLLDTNIAGKAISR